MDKVLKQRLVGAAILIALAVIFVPMLFDAGDERDIRRDSALDLPPPPADRREVRRLPLDPGRVTEPEPVAEPEPVVEPEAPAEPDEIALLAPAEEDRSASRDDAEAPAEAQPEPLDESITAIEQPAPPEPAPGPEAEPEPQPEPEPEPAEVAEEPSAGDWIVQVASFSSAETAERVGEQLERLGHLVGIDTLVRGETRLHRLRTGPYADRTGAERARSQIAATVSGVEPVVRQQPGLVAPASAPVESGYSVQVGSFAERANADRQLAQLTERGYEAFIHPDETGSRAIWRVRVGLFGARSQAVALQRELVEAAGLEGLVVNHP